MRIIEILLHFNHQAFLSHLCKCPVELAFLRHFQVQVVTMTAEHEARLLVAAFWLPPLFLVDLMAGWQQNCEKAGSQRGWCPVNWFVILICFAQEVTQLHYICVFSDNCASHSYYFNSGIHTYIHIYIYTRLVYLCTLIFVYKMNLYIWQYEL